MKFTLGKDIEKPSIGAEVDYEELRMLRLRSDSFREGYEKLDVSSGMHVERTDTNVNITFLLRRLSRKAEHVHEPNLLPIIQVINGLSTIADNRTDRLRMVRLSQNGVGLDGRRVCDATITWPEADEPVVAQLATGIMQNIAKQLRYDREIATRFGYDDHVYAAIQRERGVSLQTNPIGSCASDTNGEYYDANEPVFSLESHNVYTRKQQLIIFSGMIAIARADEYLPQVLQQGRLSDSI